MNDKKTPEWFIVISSFDFASVKVEGKTHV